LYQLFSGLHAFQQDTAVETMTAILIEDPVERLDPNRKFSPVLEHVVRHCLEKDPNERFQSARDIGFALEALSGVSTTSSAASPPLPRKSKRLRAVLVSLGLAAALGASFLIGTRLTKSPPSSVPTFLRSLVAAGT